MMAETGVAGYWRSATLRPEMLGDSGSVGENDCSWNCPPQPTMPITFLCRDCRWATFRGRFWFLKRCGTSDGGTDLPDSCSASDLPARSGSLERQLRGNAAAEVQSERQCDAGGDGARGSPLQIRLRWHSVLVSESETGRVYCAGY